MQGPILDTLYSRLKKCGDLTCAGKPFTEHRNVPDLRPSADDRRSAGAGGGQTRSAIESGALSASADIPSVRDLQALQGIPRSTLQRAFRELAGDGLIVVRQGRTAVVAGEPAEDEQPGLRRGARFPGTTASWPAASGMSATR